MWSWAVFLFPVFKAGGIVWSIGGVSAGSGKKCEARWARAIFPAQGSRSPLLWVESYLNDNIRPFAVATSLSLRYRSGSWRFTVPAPSQP